MRGGETVDDLVAVANDIGGDVDNGLRRASEALGKTAAIKGAEAAGAVPTGGRLEIVARKKHLVTGDRCIESAVPPGLAGQGADLEAVFAEAKDAGLGQDAIRDNRFGGQPGNVVAVAVRQWKGDPGVQPDGGAVLFAHVVECIRVVEMVVGRGRDSDVVQSELLHQRGELIVVGKLRVDDEGTGFGAEQ